MLKQYKIPNGIRLIKERDQVLEISTDLKITCMVVYVVKYF